MMLFKYIMFWSFILLALCHIYCEARAVNVSNTWTMPQEGLNVFYRFFRDRISWFEADAVCQFHHASLVTVDNSFQFDATRDLLRELDVNDIVWIGLIRPQSSERFMWSNSRPLIANTGYWAESLPIMEAPLCAVIDPIRDYRWHALRCGGPETASFLCEMTVPSWADACILKDIPNLTMQYMADTASVELIRSCQEEGTLRQTCKGKQDRERIIRELVCPRERMEAQRINDITTSHFKSLKIINSVHTDNNENNDIELVPISVTNYEPSIEVTETQTATEKNTVQRLIEQFNVDELMQADQPLLGLSGYKIPDEIPKPVKKVAKKYTSDEAYQKKEKPQKKVIKAEALALEDMMLGDQPQGEPELVEHVLDDEVSNEIMEVLPHRKKILPQDLKTMPSITEKQAQETTTAETITTAKAITEQTSITVHGELITSSSQPNYHLPKGDGISTQSTPAAINHPIHPHETHAHEEDPNTHKKDLSSITDNSHFIPPMLLVKSHYVPPNKHGHENEHAHEQHSEHHAQAIPATTSTTTTLSVENKNMHTELKTRIVTTAEVLANDISVSTSQSPVRTSSLIDKQTTTTTTIITPITTSSNSNPIESVAENVQEIKSNDELPTVIIERTTIDKTQTTPKNIEINTLKPNLHMNATTTTTTVKPLIDPEEVTTKTINDMPMKPVEILSSTELPESRKFATKVLNSEQEESTTTTAIPTTTRTTTMKLNGSKERSSEENSEEQERYERLFASKTTPVRAKEFEANVAAAFAAASKVGQQQPLEARTTAASVATTAKLPIDETQQAMTTTNPIKTTATATTTTTTVQPIVATTINGNVETAKTDDDKIGSTTNVNELESLSTIEPTTTTTATTTTKIQPITTTTTTAVGSSTTTALENKTTNDEELGQEEDIVATTKRQNFLWSETTTKFKPNRRRLLTKPETASYFKKILG